MRQINDEMRRQWILNDEGLYCLWQELGGSTYDFIKANRPRIDEAILNVLEGRKPVGYLIYGPL